MKPSDIRTKSALLERNLSRLAIQVRDMPARVRRFTLDETVLAEALRGETDNSETPRIRHDVDVIASTLTLRRGRFADSIERAGTVFCTTSGKVIKNGQQWYRDQGGTGIPPIVHQYALSSIAWCKKPRVADRIKMHELAALCRAALRPSRETWDRFIVNLKELCDSNEMTNDERVAVVASELTEPLLARVEDSGEPDADTIPEVIERVREKYRAAAATESQEKIKKARSEADAAKIAAWEAEKATSQALKEADAQRDAARRARSEADAERDAAWEAGEKWRSVENTASRRGQKLGSFLSWPIFFITAGAELHTILDLFSFDLRLVGWLQWIVRCWAAGGFVVVFLCLWRGDSLLRIRQRLSDLLSQWIRDRLIQFSSGPSLPTRARHEGRNRLE